MPESSQDPVSLYKPVGHVVASFPPQADLDGAVHGLQEAGFAASDVQRFSPAAMAEQAERDLKGAGPLASLGYEISLVRVRLRLAGEGYGFLVVRAPEDGDVARAKGIVARHGAQSAQRYGHLAIEELLGLDPGGPDLRIPVQGGPTAS